MKRNWKLPVIIALALLLAVQMIDAAWLLWFGGSCRLPILMYHHFAEKTNPVTTVTPEQFRALPTRVLEISRETRTANAIGDLNGAVDDMPRWCVTIGMNEIYNARKVRLGVFRDWHRAVLRHTAYGEVSGHFPATLMQTHPDALIRTTEFVANLPD